MVSFKNLGEAKGGLDVLSPEMSNSVETFFLEMSLLPCTSSMLCSLLWYCMRLLAQPWVDQGLFASHKVCNIPLGSWSKWGLSETSCYFSSLAHNST